MNPRILTLMVLAVLGGSLSYCNEIAKPCDPEKCLPPNCRCSGDNRPPGGLMPKNTPQTIVVSFDDDVEKQYMDFYDQLFDGVRNPNNCPAVGTLFVSHNYTNYYVVEDAYSRGYEIADHTVTHQEPTTYWEYANFTVWKNEIYGQREVLHRFANLPYDAIRGFRAPFLMFTENMYKVLFEANFTYDLSWPLNIKFNGESPIGPMYPYTFDYKSKQICPTIEEPCPKMSYPGLWEIPNVNIMNSDHSTCASMMDGCNPSGNASVWYEILLRNFHYHYDTNRTPFGMLMHPSYFYLGPAGDHLKAARKFLKYAESLGDVWILTASQVIDWMQDPQSIEKAKSFPPWQCPSRPPPRCSSSTANSCHYTEPRDFYMTTCTECPKRFPSPTDPDGN
ncbi:PREDICTED: uncharacterized protein LOC107353975 [Acropora digitifera]|uniref:uncharacterized protein LOC107353975 n=1 Tax=Acropora digitifera TaxID=70779 RepID=UPI00077ACAC6|nr:PREDICTED: uncharacterized protein LOC107353975 [Acropora digitifera]